jgi:hypothetical protein
MGVTEGVVKAAWERQGGRCAKCGRWLIWAQRGRESITGAWQPHRKDPEDQNQSHALANCIIFCSGMSDCHFREGHGGVDWSHHATLDDSMLLFLHAGEVEAEKNPKGPRVEKASLIEAFLGITQVSSKNGRPVQKLSRKQSHRGRAKAVGKKGAGEGVGVATDL